MTTDNNYSHSEEVLKSLCPAVREICQPIFNYLSISFFRYNRSYPDRSKFILCSDETWLTEYFKDKLYDIEYASYHKIPKIGSGISVHSRCTSTDPVCTFWNKMGDVTNYNLILALYEKYDSYLEFYNFGLKVDVHAANNIFLSNHNLFHHFIAYFREHAQDLFKQAESVKFLCKESNYDNDAKNNWMLGLPDTYEKMIVDQMPVNMVYLNGKLDSVFLTKEEAIFAKFLLNGVSMDNIHEKMHIPAEQCNVLKNSLVSKLKLTTEKELRLALTNNRIQKKISFIK